ncbi:hypothetical protein ACOMHN_014264 [Nucella lapillus]
MTWWQLSANYFTSHSGSTSRTSFPSEDELMVRKINSIFNDSHPACVQWLIEHYGGVSCTTCTDLDCLLAPRVVRCPPDSSFCLITVSDSGHSRSIARGCADQAKCDSIRHATDCAHVESAYHSGTVCEFCCSVDNCNRPPYLVPQTNTRYPQP